MQHGVPADSRGAGVLLQLAARRAIRLVAATFHRAGAGSAVQFVWPGGGVGSGLAFAGLAKQPARDQPGTGVAVLRVVGVGEYAGTQPDTAQRRRSGAAFARWA